MDINRIRTILDKEWEEVFKNKIVLFTVGLMPVILTILPLVILSTMSSTMKNGADQADVPPQFLETCGGLSGTDCFQIYMMNQFMLMFMMMPLIIPTAIAAYSIVGEKTTRSLEPLLATPITTIELLTGKALASAGPAIFISWASFLIFLLLLPLAGGSPALIKHATGPIWLLAVLVIGPLLAIAAVNMAVMVSSRVNDPRVAEQVSAVLIVPVMAILLGQTAGVIVLNLAFIFIAIAVMVLVDIAMVYFGARLFDRETILTRWK